MFKNWLEDVLGIIKSRVFILGAIFLLLMLILVRRLYILQIVNGENYLNTFTYRIQKDTEIQSPRGTIYDCNGVPLAYNKLSYTITIEDSTLLTGNKTRNTMIAALIGIVEGTGNEMIYDMPMALDDSGNIIFTAGINTIKRFKKDIYSTEDLSDAQSASTAEEVYEYMRSDRLFNLEGEYDKETALKILSIRYDLYMKRYEKYLSVEVAKDVNDKLVAAVKENADILPGVAVEQDYTRVYNDSKYFSNITGYLGAISEAELAQKQEEGNDNYSANDQIGKTGIESYYETALKGKKGSQTLYVNSQGSVLEAADVVDPVPGRNVNLTIDYDLQKTAYDMLEERIAGILLSYMAESVDPNGNPDLQIAVRDFYFALIGNNVIDISHLSAEDATDDEKEFWQEYLDFSGNIIKQLPAHFNMKRKNLSADYYKYVDLIYTMLRDDGILLADQLSDDQSVIEDWSDDKISFKSLLDHYIREDAVDISLLDVVDPYPGSEDIYNGILKWITEELPAYTDFIKQAYYYMLDTNVINGRQVCVLLYDQGILEIDDDYEQLVSGKMSAMQFMYRKVYYLEITPDMLALDPCSGSLIITDVNTGQVKALVSYPGYDANRVNDVKYFSTLVNSGSSPFFNKVTQQTLAPGSTYKPLVAIAALENGDIDENYYVDDLVEFTLVDPHAYCWNRGGHGTVNVVTAIEHSCNYFFYSVGYRMGKVEDGLSNTKGLAVLEKYASLFGLNETTGLELAEAQPHISDESCVRSAIGQGTNNYTAAEIDRYITAVASSGNLYKFTVVDSVTDGDGNVIEKNEPVIERKIEVSEKTWNLVHEGMYKVCNESDYSDYMADLGGVVIAGKSGTAQESELRPPHALFAGYAPYNDPEISMVITIPNGHGSSKVLDLYADIMCYYFNLPFKNKYRDYEAEAIRRAQIEAGTYKGSDSEEEYVDVTRHANMPDMNTGATD